MQRSSRGFLVSFQHFWLILLATLELLQTPFYPWVKFMLSHSLNCFLLLFTQFCSRALNELTLPRNTFVAFCHFGNSHLLCSWEVFHYNNTSSASSFIFPLSFLCSCWNSFNFFFNEQLLFWWLKSGMGALEQQNIQLWGERMQLKFQWDQKRQQGSEMIHCPALVLCLTHRATFQHHLPEITLDPGH